MGSSGWKATAHTGAVASPSVPIPGKTERVAEPRLRETAMLSTSSSSALETTETSASDDPSSATSTALDVSASCVPDHHQLIEDCTMML